MKQEDKYLLLLKDLCARFPYGVIVNYYNEHYTNDFILNENLLLEFRTPNRCVTLKPYLRPMSSMTKEEKEHYRILVDSLFDTGISFLSDWLNANHFDYRGLIPRGLALEAQKGMYN